MSSTHTTLRANTVVYVAGVRRGRKRGFGAGEKREGRPKSPFPSPSNARHAGYAQIVMSDLLHLEAPTVNIDSDSCFFVSLICFL